MTHRLPFAGSLLAKLRIFAAALFFFPLGMSVSLVVVPMLTLAETSENRGSRESNEELSVDIRVHQVRHSLIEGPRCRMAIVHPRAEKVQRAQRAAMESFSGHRLAIDLLAPMTC
jgi:hypothetical protein